MFKHLESIQDLDVALFRQAAYVSVVVRRDESQQVPEYVYAFVSTGGEAPKVIKIYLNSPKALAETLSSSIHALVGGNVTIGDGHERDGTAYTTTASDGSL